MIKAGDRLICKKDFYHKGIACEYYFTINNEYKVISVNNGYIYVKAHCCPDYSYNPGINFYYKKHENNNVGFSRQTAYLGNLNDYFLTLAEWREQQIKDILEDE